MTRTRLFLLLAFVLVAAACAKKEEPPPPAPPRVPVRVENQQLGIAIVDLVDALKVAANVGETIDLVPADPNVQGTLQVMMTPKQTAGVNLVEATKLHKEAILAKAGGEYKGKTELEGPLGTAFSSRGIYPEGNGLTEEIVIFMVHPAKNRELRLVYRYPSGNDSPQRLNDHMFAVLGELQALAPAGG
jgi:nitrous oxide reductase accessory protein NosL